MANPYLADFKKLKEEDLPLVRINHDALEKIAVSQAIEDFPLPDWRMPVLPKEDDNLFIEFMGVSTALNFCYDPSKDTSFSTDYKGQTWKGAMALNACLTRALEEGCDLLNPSVLSRLTSGDARHIFRGNMTIPLLEERLKILKEIGNMFCLTSIYGSFTDIFRIANFHAFTPSSEKLCAMGIVDILTGLLPSYRDYTVYKNVSLQFQKRAQLLMVIYHGRAMASQGRLAPVKDIKRIGPIADYRVPAALRLLGILRYAPVLEKKIKEGTALPKNSDEELNIRIQTVIAVAELLSKINYWRSILGKAPNYLEEINICHLDYWLWIFGRKVKDPHHITLTTAY